MSHWLCSPTAATRHFWICASLERGTAACQADWQTIKFREILSASSLRVTLGRNTTVGMDAKSAEPQHPSTRAPEAERAGRYGLRKEADVVLASGRPARPCAVVRTCVDRETLSYAVQGDERSAAIIDDGYGAPACCWRRRRCTRLRCLPHSFTTWLRHPGRAGQPRRVALRRRTQGRPRQDAAAGALFLEDQRAAPHLSA